MMKKLGAGKKQVTVLNIPIKAIAKNTKTCRIGGEIS
jgi:hypothetical protein